MKKALSIAMVLAGLVASSAWAADTPRTPAKTAGQSGFRRPCPTGLERLLPGNYYMCLAAADMADGKPTESAEMLKTAASWGSKRAQLGLGVLYFNGTDVPANRPLGLAWLTLAAERKGEPYTAIFASAQSKATPAERLQADALLTEMRPVYGDEVALARAKIRFQREMDPIRQGGAFQNADLHLAGVGNIYADYAASDIAADLGPQDFGRFVPGLIDMHRHFEPRDAAPNQAYQNRSVAARSAAPAQSHAAPASASPSAASTRAK